MSEADTHEIIQLLESLFTTAIGKEFDRIDSGTTTDNNKVYYALTAVNGSATLGSDTTVVNAGDSPSGGDTISQDATRFGSFDDIEVTAGTVYAYYRT